MVIFKNVVNIDRLIVLYILFIDLVNVGYFVLIYFELMVCL